MSFVAQKKPFASLMEEESNGSTPPLSPFQPFSEPVLMTIAEKKWCNQTIKSLKKHKRAIAFLDPVDPVQFNIPDYFDIIKSPMDLGTVENNLLNDQYFTVEAFKSDIQLIFDNCYLYNNPGDPVCLDAKKLEEHYRKLCKKEPTYTESFIEKSNTLNSYSQTPALIPAAYSNINNKNSSTLNVTLPAPVLDYDNSQPAIDDIKTPPEHSLFKMKESHYRKHLMADDDFKRCEAIVKELKKPKYKGISWPFRNPVDAAAWGATDYYDIIKNPMDMTTYERKLYNYEYDSENDLVNDIRLMFKNCYIYNPPDHLVHNLGKEFEQVFEKQWATLQARSQHRKLLSKKATLKRQRSPPSAALNQSMPKQTVSLCGKSNTNVDEEAEVHIKKKKRVSIPSQNQDVSDQKNSSKILRLKTSSTKTKEEKEAASIASNDSLSSCIVNGVKSSTSTKPAFPPKERKAKPSIPSEDNEQLIPAKKLLVSVNHQKPKETVSPSTTLKAKEPITPVSTFDIGDLYNKIHNEKKLNEQKRREEQAKYEKIERTRLEREKVSNEERMNQKKEVNQQMQIKRQTDIKERLEKLNSSTIDMSEQKLAFAQFEAVHMTKDADWRDVYTWQKDTIDYRHIPAPGFIKRTSSIISLFELRKRLLSKRIRLENSRRSNDQPYDEGSDMDID